MHSIELAVFTAADPDGFATKQRTLHAQLAEHFDGLLASLPLRSVSEPNVFADVVLWIDAATAHSAAAAMPTLPELAWFQDEIEAIRLFDHFEPTGDAAATFSRVAEAPVIEVVVTRPVATGDIFERAHGSLHEHLADADVVVGNLRLRPNASGLAGDINGWVGGDAMEQMGPEMMARAELAPVFDERNEMLIFMPFHLNASA